MPLNRRVKTNPARDQAKGYALKHPLAVRLEYLENHPSDALAFIRLAHTVNQVEELLVRGRHRSRTDVEDQLFEELGVLVARAVARLREIQQAPQRRGDPQKAEHCPVCRGCSNCDYCFQGYQMDETPCQVCQGTGACQTCNPPKKKTVWEHLRD
jgi:hypothetical protein